MMQASTFTGWNLSSTGGSSAIWRIYEGHTSPLLRRFLRGLTLADTTVTYNGAVQTGAAVPVSGLLSGTAASGRDAGSYTAYSHQQGYDLSGGRLTVTAAPAAARAAPARTASSPQELLHASDALVASSTLTVVQGEGWGVEAGEVGDQGPGEDTVKAGRGHRVAEDVGPSLRIVDGGVKLLNAKLN